MKTVFSPNPRFSQSRRIGSVISNIFRGVIYQSVHSEHIISNFLFGSFVFFLKLTVDI